MKYAGLIKNDIAAAPGMCVTFFTQGCPHHCPGCHNPETWDFAGGKEFTASVLDEVIAALSANGINRNLCIMGGEPLCPENEFITRLLIAEVRQRFPNILIYVWTGYQIEDIVNRNEFIKYIFKNIDYLIDGPYIEELRDTTIPMCGSRNQRVINMKEFDISKKI
jgi:anaerobic ribonucleoside-triphosphate reductase activating protein